MIKLASNTDCCGCSACASICPHNAITMNPDDQGFKYPCVDTNLCIDCGLCDTVCSFHSYYNTQGQFITPRVFAARKKEKDELLKSQSGGMSDSLLRSFFNHGDVAYGVGYREGFEVSHIRVTDYESAVQFRGSKYVQSNTEGIFKQVKADLKDGKRVLFFGLPCQVSGLKTFIPPTLKDSLTTIDLVCHSSSSPRVWKDYVIYLEKKYRSKIIKSNFRDKHYGWNQCIETYLLEDGRTVVSRSFVDLYFKHLIIRPSCSNCPYTNLKRVGDITIGDYWGWEKYHSEFCDNLGVSLVLVNSEKGKSLFDDCRPSLHVIDSSTEECIQPNLAHPTILSNRYSEFWDYYRDNGISKALIKYGDRGLIVRAKKFLRRVINHLTGR